MQRVPSPVNFSVCTDQDANHTRSSNLHQQVRRTVCSTLPTSMGQKCRAAAVYTSRASIRKMGATSVMEVLSCKAILCLCIRTRLGYVFCVMHHVSCTLMLGVSVQSIVGVMLIPEVLIVFRTKEINQKNKTLRNTSFGNAPVVSSLEIRLVRPLPVMAKSCSIAQQCWVIGI